MAERKTVKTLTAGHRAALGQKPASDSSPTEIPQANIAYFNRRPDLKNIPPEILRQAWFNMAHLILPQGAKVAHIGCGNGHVTYAMAKLYPDFEFIGIAAGKKEIKQAGAMYNLPNLRYEQGDIVGHTTFEEESFDAIINSFILHDIYTRARYNEQAVTKALERQFRLLKPEGLMFIRDYALRLPGEYVLLEMSDDPNQGDNPETMSEADLLVWYSENARPDEQPGCKGFFLEELPPRLPQTRLFRLTYKWAYEFAIRKDNRAEIEENLAREHSYFTERDFRKNLRALGARALYTAPHWDESYVQEHFEGRFRLMDEQGEPLGPPPTSFLVVAQKTGNSKSLRLLERRPSHNSDGRLRITTVRDDQTGKLTDMVSRDLDSTDLIPYRVTPEGKLHIFIHEAVPRGIINAVPRMGRDLDGKRWSGHMAEALSVPTDMIYAMEKGGFKEIAKFSRDFLGLKPTLNATLDQGPTYYPAPDFIEEAVRTRYLQVNEYKDPIEPKVVMDDIRGFTSPGRIREFNAQQILDAISIGYIPNARLEMQILHLFSQLGIKAETWQECPLALEDTTPELTFDGMNFAQLKAEDRKQFTPVRGRAGQLRKVNSVFVDEGWQDGFATGMAARDISFVIPEEQTLNKAVILPLTRSAGQVMVGMETTQMPVPERLEGNGTQMKAPSINLPKSITSMHEARKYIAELYNIPPENVWRLGERYYCHAGLTPVRVYPFAIATQGQASNPTGGPIQYAPMSYVFYIMFRLIGWRHDQDFLYALNKACSKMGYDRLDRNLKQAMNQALKDHNNALKDKGTGGASAKKPAGSSEQSQADKQENKKNSPKALSPRPEDWHIN